METAVTVKVATLATMVTAAALTTTDWSCR